MSAAKSTSLHAQPLMKHCTPGFEMGHNKVDGCCDGGVIYAFIKPEESKGLGRETSTRLNPAVPLRQALI